MKSIFLTLSLLLAVPALAEQSSKNVEMTQEKSNELKVGVKGMVCAFCAQGIEKKFKAQKEVDSVTVSLENKFVKLKFKDGQRLSNERITEVLKDAGYDAVFGGE